MNDQRKLEREEWTLEVNNFVNRIIVDVADADFIPQILYDKLPTILKTSCNVFSDPRERDVFLLGILAALGGVSHNLIAYNEVDRKGVAPNIAAFIIAPPASGKRVLEYAKKMIYGVRDTFAGKENRRLIVPANNSSSGFLQLLQDNDGVGVMIESEIDTLLNAQKQDWGKNNDIIRNSFENESYVMYRKKDKEYISIERPRPSFALSGTENQFRELMGSAENGLFSRGCYYVFDDIDTELKSFGRLNTEVDVDARFVSFASIVNDYYIKLTQFEKVKVNFSEMQLACIQGLLQEIYDVAFDQKELHANIKRGFVNALKISTVLEWLFRCENDSLEEIIPCSNAALQAGILLTFISISHAERALEFLPKVKVPMRSDNHERLYSSLPAIFLKAEAIQAALTLGMCEKTGYNAMKTFGKKGWIKLLPNGKYQKVK